MMRTVVEEAKGNALDHAWCVRVEESGQVCGARGKGDFLVAYTAGKLIGVFGGDHGTVAGMTDVEIRMVATSRFFFHSEEDRWSSMRIWMEREGRLYEMKKVSQKLKVEGTRVR